MAPAPAATTAASAAAGAFGRIGTSPTTTSPVKTARPAQRTHPAGTAAGWDGPGLPIMSRIVRPARRGRPIRRGRLVSGAGLVTAPLGGRRAPGPPTPG